MHTYAPPNSVFEGPVTNRRSVLRILIKKIFSRAHLKGKKGRNDFKFGTFIDRFQSDGAASVAVKGLIAFTDLRHKFRRRKH